jgi:hypothetical protein
MAAVTRRRRWELVVDVVLVGFLIATAAAGVVAIADEYAHLGQGRAR